MEKNGGVKKVHCCQCHGVINTITPTMPQAQVPILCRECFGKGTYDGSGSIQHSIQGEGAPAQAD